MVPRENVINVYGSLLDIDFRISASEKPVFRDLLSWDLIVGESPEDKTIDDWRVVIASGQEDLAEG